MMLICINDLFIIKMKIAPTGKVCSRTTTLQPLLRAQLWKFLPISENISPPSIYFLCTSKVRKTIAELIPGSLEKEVIAFLFIAFYKDLLK
ncbi:MAG: hypothetical protein ABI760_10320 [Ferruginibacter sp.]